jgi:fido (protein-threonine AMPylation protein)
VAHCEHCARIKRNYPPEELEDFPAPCRALDLDLLEQLEARRPRIAFPAAVEVHQTIERNAAQVEAFIQTFAPRRDMAFLWGYLETIHSLLFQGAGLDYAGQFRSEGEPVEYGSASRPRSGTPAAQIKPALQHLFERCIPMDPSALNLEALRIAAARLVYGILCIHPFMDGNGRAARYMFKALVNSTGRHFAKPFESRLLGSDDESRYLAALHEVDLRVDMDIQDGLPDVLPLADYLLTYIGEIDEDDASGPNL